jgi:hypothetical protein
MYCYKQFRILLNNFFKNLLITKIFDAGFAWVFFQYAV